VTTILWQDDTALVVDKPSGVLVHNSAYAGPKERSLRQDLGQALGRRVYPVHRLDRGASGLLLLATEPGWVAAWQEALAGEAAAKDYLALCRGRLLGPQEVESAVADAHGVRRPARSLVEPLLVSSTERCSLVRVRIVTGRLHQVRQHLDHLSHPVIGDTTHGEGRTNRHYRAAYGVDRLVLHAWALRVRHPRSGEALALTAPIPPALTAIFERLFDYPASGITPPAA
jgi:tRNA pseudouridine65 synthase